MKSCTLKETLRSVAILFVLIMGFHQIQAQSNEERAKAYYFQAEEAFTEKEYDKAINYCDQVVEILGSSNALVETLYVKSYYAQNKIAKAKEALNSFSNFRLDDASLSREIAPYIVKIEEAEKEEKKRQEIAAKKVEEREKEEKRKAELAAQKKIEEKQRALQAKAERERQFKKEEQQRIKLQLEQGLKPDKYDFVGSFTTDGLAVIRHEDTHEYGFINKNGIEVVPTEYQYVREFENGVAIVELNNKWGVIDATGKRLTEIKYDEIELFFDERAVVSINKTYGFIDINGNEIVPLTYHKVRYFREGRGKVSMEGKWGLIDKTGKKLTPIKYDIIHYFYNGLALVELDDKFGFIDAAGKEVVPLIYEELDCFNGPLAKAKLNGKWFFIDKNGNVLK